MYYGNGNNKLEHCTNANDVVIIIVDDSTMHLRLNVRLKLID